MFVEVSAQFLRLACVDQLYGTSKYGIFNALVMGKFQLIRDCGFLYALFQPRPACKSALASDGELRVADAKLYR